MSYITVVALDEWEGIYINGICETQGDPLSTYDLLFFLKRVGLLSSDVEIQRRYVGDLPREAVLDKNRYLKHKLSDIVDNQYQALWQKAIG